jgi:hypothetical protein
VNHGFRGGFNDIRRQTHAVETTAVVVHDDIHLTQRVFALTFGVQVIFDQLNVIAGDAVDRLINSVDRAVAVGGFRFDLSPQASLTRRWRYRWSRTAR